LELAEVQLRGEAMEVRIGRLLRRQTLELESPFRVRGTIRFSGEGLNRSLAHPNWNWLADQLAEDLLGIQPLASLNLQDDRLILQACSGGPTGVVVERAARLEARQGSIEVVGVEGEWSSRLPMDPAIRIETACVGGDHLELGGEATLFP
jgi:hypothetical protein